LTLEPLTSVDDQKDARPAKEDAGGQPESSAGRRLPPAAPVIALRMEGLLTWTAERVAKFPRDHKFTVGDRLLETCLDIMAALTEAAYRRDKQAVLAAASRGLVRARILSRLARVLLCLSEAQHLHFVRESDEVGRMLGGWIRSGASR
jgi:hypothetical protein